MNQTRHKDTQSLRKFNRIKKAWLFPFERILNTVMAQIMANFMEECDVAISLFFSSPLGLNLANIQIGYNSNRILTSAPTRISLWYCIYVNKVKFITVAESWTQNSPIANMKRPTKAEQVPLRLMLQFQQGRWFGRLLWQRRGWSEFESAPLLNS